MTNPLTALTTLTASLFDPAGRFAVLDACNGNRSFKALLILAFILAVVNRNRPRRALVLLITAAALSILFNQMRVATLIMLGHLSQNHWQIAHNLLGYLFILPSIFILIKLSERFAK